MVENNLSYDAGHKLVSEQKRSLALKQDQTAPFGCCSQHPHPDTSHTQTATTPLTGHLLLNHGAARPQWAHSHSHTSPHRRAPTEYRPHPRHRHCPVHLRVFTYKTQLKLTSLNFVHRQFFSLFNTKSF